MLVLHEKDAGIRQVIAVEEFALGRARAPEPYFWAIGGLEGLEDVLGDGAVAGFILLDGFPIILLGEFGQVHLADQGWEDMGVVEVEVVFWPIEVGGHDGQVIGTVLTVVGCTELDAGDLGDGIGFIGAFEGAGQEVFFPDRLRAVTRIDATGAQKQELTHIRLEGGVNDIGLDGEIVVEKVRRIALVGPDPTHFCCGQEHVFGTLFGKEGLHGGLIGEIKFGMPAGDDVAVAIRGKSAHEG